MFLPKNFDPFHRKKKFCALSQVSEIFTHINLVIYFSKKTLFHIFKFEKFSALHFHGGKFLLFLALKNDELGNMAVKMMKITCHETKDLCWWESFLFCFDRVKWWGRRTGFLIWFDVFSSLETSLTLFLNMGIKILNFSEKCSTEDAEKCEKFSKRKPVIRKANFPDTEHDFILPRLLQKVKLLTEGFKELERDYLRIIKFLAFREKWFNITCRHRTLCTRVEEKR